ncbi:MAG: radical SAM protein [Elusimicrobiales bacterium]|nr:radical SAM protein [Elusimicrobiales bacterium]
MEQINHSQLYRLPWNYSDNIITWLEPTKKCNIYCEGCYSANNPASHKTIEQIKSDLDVFEKYRNTHSVSIAGGEPLCHPQIAEIVRLVAARGWQPVVNTNGFAMTEEIMRSLKQAGLKGLTFHIDSLQKRPGWENKNELELCRLRQQYADMAARVGGLSCAFNATIYEETLPYVPKLLEWAHANIDKVNVMVFIDFRAARLDAYDCYAKGKKVDIGALVYGGDKGRKTDITAHNVLAEIRKTYPDYMPCAYLGGTEDPAALKWLLTLRVATKNRVLGYMGPKFIEMAQTLHHLFRGKYLGYVHPKMMSLMKWVFPLAMFDAGLSSALGNWLKTLSNPFNLFKPVYMQSVMMIQPVDVSADGRQSMCDGCPDMTVYDGRLVWSCRLEEPLRYGCFLQMAPRAANTRGQEHRETVAVSK